MAGLNQPVEDSARHGGLNLNFDTQSARTRTTAENDPTDSWSRDSHHSGFGGNNTSSDYHGRDTTNSGNYDRDRATQRAQSGSSNQPGMPSSQLNPMTDRSYGQNSGIGQYSSSVAHNVHHGQPHDHGFDHHHSGQQSNTIPTGANSGQGIHAQQYSDRERMLDPGTGTTTILTGGLDPAHHGGNCSHSNVQGHCDDGGSMHGGQTYPAGTSTTVQAGEPRRSTQTTTAAPASRSADTTQSANLGTRLETTSEIGTTVTKSPYNLKPGETIVEKETRVHTGGVPVLDHGTRSDKKSGHGMRSNQTTTNDQSNLNAGFGATAGFNPAHDQYGRTGASKVGSQQQRNLAEQQRENVTRGKATVGDKIVGGFETATGTATSNPTLLNRGEERLAGGVHAVTKN